MQNCFETLRLIDINNRWCYHSFEIWGKTRQCLVDMRYIPRIPNIQIGNPNNELICYHILCVFIFLLSVVGWRSPAKYFTIQLFNVTSGRWLLTISFSFQNKLVYARGKIAHSNFGELLNAPQLEHNKSRRWFENNNNN